MFLRNDKGFTLASVMVAAGLLGGLSLVVMQLTKNINQSQSFAQSKTDEIELKTSIRLLLDDDRHCRVSLAGDGASGTPITPVTFNKEDIDEDNEGLDVALYLSNQVGDARGLKKFNGSNNPGGDDKSKYGNLTITSMKLIMNNGIGSNYSESIGHNDVGQLRVVAQKKISGTQTRDLVMNFDLNVGMATDSSNETTILSCDREKSGLTMGACPNSNVWICSCSADSTSSTEGKVYGCMHCDEDKLIDDFWLAGFHATGGNASCPAKSSINPPGPDPVYQYRVYDAGSGGVTQNIYY